MLPHIERGGRPVAPRFGSAPYAWFEAWGRRFASAISIVASATAVAACATQTNRVITTSSSTEFTRCLKLRGVAHPEDLQGRSRQELAVPGLESLYGLRVPVGVNRATFATIVKTCSKGELHVGRVPVTSPILRRRVLGLAACLARDGFVLPPPDFPGPGPVIDTADIDTSSARWVATATGCGIDRGLSKTALQACMGASGLTGRADTNEHFQQRLLELPRCLKRSTSHDR